jgi:hypothetical protein
MEERECREGKRKATKMYIIERLAKNPQGKLFAFYLEGSLIFGKKYS